MKSSTVLFLFLSFSLQAQFQVFVEVKQTVDTVYEDYYTGVWYNKLVHGEKWLVPEVVKRPVGVDSIETIRLYYVVYTTPIKAEKIYLPFEAKAVFASVREEEQKRKKRKKKANEK